MLLEGSVWSMTGSKAYNASLLQRSLTSDFSNTDTEYKIKE